MFVTALVRTSIESNESELGGLVEKFMKVKDLLNMKTTYGAINCILSHLINSTENEDKCLRLLKIVESLNAEVYNQIILHHLRQTTD